MLLDTFFWLRQVLGDLAELWQKYECFWKIFLKALPNLFSNYRICDNKWVYNFRMNLHWSPFKAPYLYSVITKVNKDQAFQNISFIPPSIQITISNKYILDSFSCRCPAWHFTKQLNSRNKVQELCLWTIQVKKNLLQHTKPIPNISDTRLNVFPEAF